MTSVIKSGVDNTPLNDSSSSPSIPVHTKRLPPVNFSHDPLPVSQYMHHWTFSWSLNLVFIFNFLSLSALYSCSNHFNSTSSGALLADFFRLSFVSIMTSSCFFPLFLTWKTSFCWCYSTSVFVKRTTSRISYTFIVGYTDLHAWRCRFLLQFSLQLFSLSCSKYMECAFLTDFTFPNLNYADNT